MELTAEEILQVESNQRQHYETMLFQSKQVAAIEAEEYNKFALLKPKIYIDGNQWCVLLGDDIVEGIVGFGDTPYLAILDWNRAWTEQALKTK